MKFFRLMLFIFMMLNNFIVVYGHGSIDEISSKKIFYPNIKNAGDAYLVLSDFVQNKIDIQAEFNGVYLLRPGIENNCYIITVMKYDRLKQQMLFENINIRKNHEGKFLFKNQYISFKDILFSYENNAYLPVENFESL